LKKSDSKKKREPKKTAEVVYIGKYEHLFNKRWTENEIKALADEMLDYLGYTDSMIKKCPTLFNKNGFEKFCNYLYYKGLRNISFYNIQNKYYIYTKIGE